MILNFKDFLEELTTEQEKCFKSFEKTYGFDSFLTQKSLGALNNTLKIKEHYEKYI